MIIRTPKNKENPYVMVNKFAMSDSSLTLQAKGLLGYLLSLPDDWVVKPRELVKHHKNGRDAIYRVIRELISTGYLERVSVKNAINQFQRTEYIVREYPSLVKSVLSKHPESPYPGNQDAEQNRAFADGEVVVLPKKRFHVRGSRGKTGRQLKAAHDFAAMQNRRASEVADVQ